MGAGDRRIGGLVVLTIDHSLGRRRVRLGR